MEEIPFEQFNTERKELRDINETLEEMYQLLRDGHCENVWPLIEMRSEKIGILIQDSISFVAQFEGNRGELSEEEKMQIVAMENYIMPSLKDKAKELRKGWLSKNLGGKL